MASVFRALVTGVPLPPILHVQCIGLNNIREMFSYTAQVGTVATLSPSRLHLVQ